MLAAGRTPFRVPDACCSISIAQRTVGQTRESLDSLTFFSRLSTELHCPHYLKAYQRSGMIRWLHRDTLGLPGKGFTLHVVVRVFTLRLLGFR